MSSEELAANEAAIIRVRADLHELFQELHDNYVQSYQVLRHMEASLEALRRQAEEDLLHIQTLNLRTMMENNRQEEFQRELNGRVRMDSDSSSGTDNSDIDLDFAIPAALALFPSPQVFDEGQQPDNVAEPSGEAKIEESQTATPATSEEQPSAPRIPDETVATAEKRKALDEPVSAPPVKKPATFDNDVAL